MYSYKNAIELSYLYWNHTFVKVNPNTLIRHFSSGVSRVTILVDCTMALTLNSTYNVFYMIVLSMFEVYISYCIFMAQRFLFVIYTL